MLQLFEFAVTFVCTYLFSPCYPKWYYTVCKRKCRLWHTL